MNEERSLALLCYSFSLLCFFLCSVRPFLSLSLPSSNSSKRKKKQKRKPKIRRNREASFIHPQDSSRGITCPSALKFLQPPLFLICVSLLPSVRFSFFPLFWHPPFTRSSFPFSTFFLPFSFQHWRYHLHTHACRGPASHTFSPPTLACPQPVDLREPETAVAMKA